MIKKVEYDLNYRIKGKVYTKKIEVDFVPNKRHEDYSKIQNEIISIRSKWQNIGLLEEEMIILRETKPEEFRSSIKVFTEEIKKLEDEIKSSKVDNLIERRFNLVKDILIDNGYSDDADLMSWDFWNNSVNPSDINDMLELFIWKDIEKKKIVH